MFFKTLKHDLKNSFKDYSMMFIIMIIFAVVAPFLLKSNIVFLQGITTIILTAVFTGACVMMVINGINFFKRRLFTDSSYLNLTLPVKTEVTIFSKLVTVGFWQFVTTIMLFVSIGIFIFVFSNFNNQLIDYIFKGIIDAFKRADWLVVITSFIYFFTSALLALSVILLSMTIVNTSYFKRPNYFISIAFFLFFYMIKAFLDDAVYRFLNINSVTRLDSYMRAGDATSFSLQTMSLVLYDFVIFGLIFVLICHLFKKKIEL